MNGETIVQEGRTLCAELETVNKDDFLTSKIVAEILSIIRNIELLDIENKIIDINNKVNTRRKKMEEEEKEQEQK